VAVRTRFAPSPTGYLHVGSARTALFNWLHARHAGGTFILRVEDTDKERSRPEFEEEIIESLRWLGLDWDGPIGRQSARFDFYRTQAEKLIARGLAYREGEAVRFRLPQGQIGWDDVVRGRIEFDGKLLEDLVIMKSDGSATYNFACVCDDGEMGITHVVRGEDHISNTPKQIPLYEALGHPLPRFAHIPLILGTDRSRLSKRHGATSIREFREIGYLPEAMVNYLALLGWSPGGNREIMSRAEIVKEFDLGRVLSTGAIFSREKMDWMNGEYLRALGPDALADLYAETLRKAGVLRAEPDRAWMKRFAELHRQRIFVLGDLAPQTGYFFTDEVGWDAEGEKVLRQHPGTGETFLAYADALESLADFSQESVEKASRALMEARGLSGKQFIHPARVAVTGRTVSPGFFETVALLGKERSVARLRAAARKLKAPVAG
jgi:glutamyl-tRNA synthetase